LALLSALGTALVSTKTILFRWPLTTTPILLLHSCNFLHRYDRLLLIVELMLFIWLSLPSFVPRSDDVDGLENMLWQWPIKRVFLLHMSTRWSHTVIDYTTTLFAKHETDSITRVNTLL
jgi:hypothetical protein